MARVLRAIDLREPPPLYELANGTRIQIAYLDAAGWALLEAWEATPADEGALRALLQAAAPTADLAVIDRYASDPDIGNIIALAKGRSPEIIQALKNGLSADVPAVVSAPSPTPPSVPTTTSPSSSVGSLGPTVAASAKSTRSRGTKPSSLSTP